MEVLVAMSISLVVTASMVALMETRSATPRGSSNCRKQHAKSEWICAEGWSVAGLSVRHDYNVYRGAHPGFTHTDDVLRRARRRI